jgi:hypothetical protein
MVLARLRWWTRGRHRTLRTVIVIRVLELHGHGSTTRDRDLLEHFSEWVCFEDREVILLAHLDIVQSSRKLLPIGAFMASDCAMGGGEDGV